MVRIMFFIALSIGLMLPGAVWVDEFTPAFQSALTNVVAMIAILLSIFIAGKYLDKRPFQDFGITLFPIKEFLLGLVFGAILMITLFGVQILFGWIELKAFYFNRYPEFAFYIVLSAQIIRYLMGAIFEEAFTRSYLLINIAEGLTNRLQKKKAVLISYVFTSSIFGILHLGNPSASWLSTINLILIGLLFGITVIKMGKLHFAIGLHAAWNIFQNNVFGAPNSGKKTVASIFTFSNSGPGIWTGGEFGVEGSLLCTLICLITLLILLILFKDRPQQIL